MTVPSRGKSTEQLDLTYTVSWSINWYNHFGKLSSNIYPSKLKIYTHYGK